MSRNDPGYLDALCLIIFTSVDLRGGQSRLATGLCTGETP